MLSFWLNRSPLKLAGVVTLIVLLISSAGFAEKQLVDPQIPQSWYDELKTASELGIEKFDQSPMLDSAVDSEELAPVGKRLPDNPPVIEPYNKVGNYGGTLQVWRTKFSGGNAPIFEGPHPSYGRATPEIRDMVPYMIKDWEWGDNGKVLTIELYEGLKWSDGQPFTTEDIMYWWHHEANNEDLNATPPDQWSPPINDVKRLGRYTVEIHYGTKARLNVEGDFNAGVSYGLRTPAHYLKKFHPDFVDEQELKKKAKEAGFESWVKYYNYKKSQAHPKDGNPPTLRPFITAKRTTTHLILERNPYFPFVDTAGNQLPYIDKIRVNKANKSEMMVTKQSTGKSDLAGFQADAQDIPLYRTNEEKYDFETLLYTRGGRGICINYNLNHKEEAIRKIFQNAKFRRAMSVAINRSEINQKAYFGKGVPGQFTVLPSSRWYEERFANSYADYRPERARKLLDEIGMKDVNGDGWRERPDGKKFQPVVLYMGFGGPTTKIFELVKSYWADVGINVQLKKVGWSLWIPRHSSGKFDIGFLVGDNGLTDLKNSRSWLLSKYFAPGSDTWFSPWPLWAKWYSSDGEKGAEPPKNVKELHDTMMKIGRSAERNENWVELGKKLLESQAEQLWTTGLVGLTPKPVLIDGDLQNVPKKGIWNDDGKRLQPYYPVQFYFSEQADELE